MAKDEKLIIPKKYKPLFEIDIAKDILNDPGIIGKKSLSDEELKHYTDLSKVHTAIVTGGRFSVKSFAVGTASCVWSHNYENKVLYSRYTLTSAKDSIVPEFEEKLDYLNVRGDFQVNKDRVTSVNGSEIVFRGIKTSSGNQTANLKSLKGFSRFILEEAEEMPSFDDWDKIRLSIRQVDKKNVSVLILNPATKQHWIYQKFFLEKGVAEGSNCIKDGVLYIHTDYRDVNRKFIPDEIFERYEDARLVYEEYESLTHEERKLFDPVKEKTAKWFKSVILGGWLDQAEGVIYTDWIEEKFPEDMPYSFGLDYGYEPHPTALVKVAIDHDRRRIYVKQCVYSTKLDAEDIAKAVQRHCEPSDLIISDSADKRMNMMLRRSYNLNIQPTIKGHDSVITGIRTVQSFTICVDPDSIDIKNELNNYIWNDKRAGIPVKENDDALDGVRYNVARLVLLK